MRQPTKRLHMHFLAIDSVKAPGHEMSASPFLEQAAGHHFYAGLRCHVVVGEFNAAELLWFAEFDVSHAIEFQNPVIIARWDIRLARDHVSLIIDCDDGFRAGTTRRCAYAEDVLNCGGVFRRVELRR